MTTTTLTGQQQAVAVLSRILATPGLVQATWTVHTDRTSDFPGLVAHVPSRPVKDARAAVAAYALAFELDFEAEEYLAGDGRCAGFMEIQAIGVIDNMRVKVWCPGRGE